VVTPSGVLAENIQIECWRKFTENKKQRNQVLPINLSKLRERSRVGEVKPPTGIAVPVVPEIVPERPKGYPLELLLLLLLP